MGLDRVLVVDDDKLNVELLATLLEKENCAVVSAFNGRQGWDTVQKEPVDLVLMDLRMPRMGGMELLKKIKKATPHTIIIMMTAYATVESAVEAMKFGAYDYVIKPLRSEQVAMLLRRLRERDELYWQNEYLREELAAERACDRLVTVDENMRRICEATRLAANSKASVLVQGESGTGKELIARYIHEMSPRKNKPFIRVNCAALPATLLESELFGHEKGAFTGAVAQRRGRFELADGGTLLLDEISEVSPPLQAELLRVLEEEEFDRVGGSKTLRVDVRVIATTNQDMRRTIAESKFRRDLYYRLNVIPIVLPPLRARRVDVPPLVNHFLEKFSAEKNRPVPHFTEEAMQLMCRYAWPGNVRELKNSIQRLVILHDVKEIGVEHLPGEIREGGLAQTGTGVFVGQAIEEVERWLILKTLQHTAGNRTAAAGMLGVTTRTLRNKLGRYRKEGVIPGAEALSPAGEEISHMVQTVPPGTQRIPPSGGRNFPGTPFADFSPAS